MHLYLTPLAVAISSTLFLSSTVLAASGGAAGTTTNYDQNQFSQGKPGTNDVGLSNGQNGNDITDRTISPDQELNGPPGGNGQDATDTRKGGGGAGGQGGGSLFGGFSSGGAAGVAEIQGELNANGGNGGEVSHNTVTLDHSLTGSAGGNGGNTEFGGSGAGGAGGGSAFGGFSSGGAGGYAEGEQKASDFLVKTEGGSGADVTQNTLNIRNATLTGARGGDSGIPDDEGGGGIGNGGHGGGSAFGGVSSGAAGGYAKEFFSPSNSNGGLGGNVIGNTVTLTSTNLIGGAGGNSGEILEYNEGGGGIGGNGGGSIFGGLSTGGAGGFQITDSSTPEGASGGNAGNVSGNKLVLTNINLTGADGGHGGGYSELSNEGSGVSSGGGGTGGQGGGSIIGGLSNGGAGGKVQEISKANGGNGGDTNNNEITVIKAIIKGATGGDAGVGNNDEKDYTIGGISGIGGNGGGSVIGGLSNGGAGGVVEGGSAVGGQGGNIKGNIISLTDADITGGVGGSGSSTKTAAGPGGHGGASVFGGLSHGGTGGITEEGNASGGKGGDISNNTISLTDVKLTGAAGGTSGDNQKLGITGSGGYGGGSVFGGLSGGGSGGLAEIALGGNGGNVSNNDITLTHVELVGAAGGAVGEGSDSGTASSGGDGGGSIYGGVSNAGAGGFYNDSSTNSRGNGGNGGEVSFNTITVSDSKLTGGAGSHGGNGGGSAFGGSSNGGAGGYAQEGSANGGQGANITGNKISMTKTQLSGAEGGSSIHNKVAGGAGGHGGGSVFGGLTNGGSGGATEGDGTASGGNGGTVSSNEISLTDVVLTGAVGGATSDNGEYIAGSGGYGGGSVFGGLSSGGTGGRAETALGGNGGNVSKNKLTLTHIVITGAAGGAAGEDGGSGGDGGGSIYGGVSNAGTGGYYNDDSPDSRATGGNGGNVNLNEITVSDSTITGGAGGNDGNGGNGGGSVFGGTSNGGAGGHSQEGSAAGGLGGDIKGNIISLTKTRLSGAEGGSGSSNTQIQGPGGHGGGSVFGGLSNGGAGGVAEFSDASGGNGGTVSDNTISLTDVVLTGAAGGASSYNNWSDIPGSGGYGGGSVFGGLSSGGKGGFGETALGGNGGNVSRNNLTLIGVTLTGAVGGATGERSGTNAYGSGGDGGGSIYGGVSNAGAGGYDDNYLPKSRSNGGNGGDVNFNTITVSSSTITGGAASQGGNGGGSVFGGLSNGGAGGKADDGNASGGNGGNISTNIISLSDTVLIGAAGGTSGDAEDLLTRAAKSPSDGHMGGSVYGGLSRGGAGGVSDENSNGGNGGDVTGNTINISGASKISGDLYGGYSQGGAAGANYNGDLSGIAGLGGLAQNNTVTLNGALLSIAGAVYGGQSVDGNGMADASKAFSGNTLNLNGYRGSLAGIYNFEHYNWVLPKNVVNQDTLITITGPDKVNLTDTRHTVAMESDGNQLKAGDKVVLIDKAQGATSTSTNIQVEQGHFIIYDANLGIDNDAFVLNIDRKNETDSSPAGKLNPKSEAFLQGRAAALAFTNQGTDMLRESLNTCATNFFLIGDGGSNRYDTGSNIRVRDFKMALGLRSCLELQDTSKMMVGAFIDHGQGNYDSYNSFAGYGDVHGTGDLRYTGAGLMLHMDVAGTASKESAAPVVGSKNGVYVDAVMRAGKVKASFDSNDLVDAGGVRGHYNSKSNYVSAMAGIGYAFNLDEKQSVDVYSRYSWSRIDADKVMIGNDKLSFGSDNSSRLRAGTRYTYAATPKIAPYAGIAYEHEFAGKVSGKVFDMSIKKPDMGGSTGIVEVGISTTPIASVTAVKLDVGVQGFFGERKGTTGTVNLSYEF